MNRAHHSRPVYMIEKTTKGPAYSWRIMRFARPGDSIGTVIDYKPSRKQAMVTASLLAGRTADVVVWKS